ncbi:hypothetical protein SAMN05216464_103279 [Mucilaginibacter pineti]|uniref:RNA polymerase, alpha chain C terminal domain n=1 Tax=Mucilaginibacter pineti TaxID=1391627 RepID=A0A1G6ZD04_9SPHI|nr:hypothetical protein [Mucilaginibacter pineti]SDD99636.1 hypothetical protein SAMN05216464_103279 [Mucilaginibacter pineti]
MEIKEVINKPVNELGVGKEFINGCERMGFKTLKDILVLTPKQLISKDGFNYNWLGDLVKYLSGNGLLHYLQPLPGREKEDVSSL